MTKAEIVKYLDELINEARRMADRCALSNERLRAEYWAGKQVAYWHVKGVLEKLED
jgi:hypothetical protein